MSRRTYLQDLLPTHDDAVPANGNVRQDLNVPDTAIFPRLGRFAVKTVQLGARTEQHRLIFLAGLQVYFVFVREFGDGLKMDVTLFLRVDGISGGPGDARCSGRAKRRILKDLAEGAFHFAHWDRGFRICV